MMLIEETTLPDAALPTEEFRSHLRMGSGFGDDSLQDALLLSFLRAAMSAIEARTGKALLQRGFLWSLTKWQGVDTQILPLAPVTSVSRVTLIGKNGDETDLSLDQVRLAAHAHQPSLKSSGTALPSIPSGGSVDIRFAAGFGPAWGDLPPDLAQAVLLLAAHYYEFRSETSLSEGCMPFGVASLIERYKPVRIGFGGGA